MARTRVIGTQDAANSDDAARQEAEEFAKLNQTGGGDLFAAVDELRGGEAAGVVCIITRTAPTDRQGYVGQLSVSEFSREKMRVVYGPGRYMVQIKGPKGFLPGGGQVQIADGGDSSSAGRPAGGGDFFTMLEWMEKRDAERKKDTSDKSWRLAELSIPIVGSLLTSLLTRNTGPSILEIANALKPPAPPSLADITATMRNMHELSSPKESSKESQVETIFNMMERARELFESGSDKGGSTWMDVVRDLAKEAPAFLQPIMQVIAARSQPGGFKGGIRPPQPPAGTGAVPLSAPGANPAAALAPSGPAGAGAAPPFAGNAADGSAQPSSPGENPVNMLDMMKPLIKQKLKVLALWAQQDRNPATYAEVFCDEHVPANIYDMIPPDQMLGYLNHEQWFETVCEWEPALSNFRPWCDDFRKELIDIVRGEEEEVTPPQPAPPPVDL